jgi:nucleotide-binding universal stress UspA family protein
MATNRRWAIVCGVDGSDRSAVAARTAAHLAIALGTRLELVRVVTPPENGADRQGNPSGAFRDVPWSALHTLDAGPPVELVLEVGEPARRLCTLAESEQALLVIGAPANAAAEHGVASTIVAESRVPVVLVPHCSEEVARAPGTGHGEMPVQRAQVRRY